MCMHAGAMLLHDMASADTMLLHASAYRCANAKQSSGAQACIHVCIYRDRYRVAVTIPLFVIWCNVLFRTCGRCACMQVCMLLRVS